MSAISTLTSIFLLALLVIAGLMYGTAAIGSTDKGVNLTGTAYEESYDAMSNTAATSIGFMQLLPILVGIGALLFAVLMIGKTL